MMGERRGMTTQVIGQLQSGKMGTISKVFKSLKPHSEYFPPKSLSSPNPSKLKPHQSEVAEPRKNQWSVYLILSTNSPIKTYVGVTNNFPRRLKQHNGELRGGAKASRAGRPWVCACLINGFHDKSEACRLEFQWKQASKKSSCKRKASDSNKQAEDGSLSLLLHRQIALSRVQSKTVCSHLDINWRFELS